MNFRENILLDYNDANENNYKLLKLALSELLDKTYNIENNDKILNIIEGMIDERAQKIMSNKYGNVETDVYSMNIFNLYLCKIFFKKRREIFLIYDENDLISNNMYDSKSRNEIKPKYIQYRKRKFFKFF